MAHAKQTACKSLAGRLHGPVKKKKAPSPLVETFISHGDYAGAPKDLLIDLLQAAGLSGAITLIFVMKKVCLGDRDEWRSKVDIIDDGKLILDRATSFMSNW